MRWRRWLVIAATAAALAILLASRVDGPDAERT